MHVTFHGAARQVTGSMHLLNTGRDLFVLDCGMFQGRRKESAEQNRVLPVDPKLITNIVISHAHIDHSGRLPMVTKNDFHGRIYCTRPTHDACDFLLADSARIQESDAHYLNYKLVRNTLSDMKKELSGRNLTRQEQDDIKSVLKKKKHELDTEAIAGLIDRYHLDGITPLYSVEDAEHAMTLFNSVPYRNPVTIGNDTTCTFYEAGHIIGSAVSIIKARVNGRIYKIGYTGDIGRYDTPIIRDPCSRFMEEDQDLDLLIMESTYGDRLHEPVTDMQPGLKKVITETIERRGSVIIPAFAFGRTQELLYHLHELYEANEVPKVPVYVDSPLATRLTRVYGEHPEVYDTEAHEIFLAKGRNPFSFKQLRFVKSVEESMALNRDQNPHIVLSASGMCEGGRILHHLRHKIHDQRNTILVVGYMAQNTLGRRILELGLEYEAAGRKGDAPVLKFYNKEYPLKARVVRMGGFSAHGDRDELFRFLKNSDLRPKKIAVVHGEEDQSEAFAQRLGQDGYDAFVPLAGEVFEF